MDNEIAILTVICELAEELQMRVAAYSQPVADNVKLSQYKQRKRDFAENAFFTAMDNAVALVGALSSDLIDGNFKPAKLLDYIPNGGPKEDGLALLGSYHFMQEVARRDYGFYTVLHALLSQFSDLATAAKQKKEIGILQEMADKLCLFAKNAFEFYNDQLRVV